MSRRPCTPTVTASPANMCRRTLFDHTESSPSTSTITCLFNTSGDEDAHFGSSCENGFNNNPRATAAIPVFPTSSEGSFRFPIAHHPSATGHHVKHLPRLATVPTAGWSDSRPFSKSLRRNTMATCEEEEDDLHYTDGSWNRRSAFLDFSDDSTPRRPSGVMDEHESPTPPRYQQQQSFRDPSLSFGRNTIAFPVTSAASSAPHVSLSMLPKSTASFSTSYQQQRDMDIITDRPLRRGTQCGGFGFQGGAGSFSGFALSRDDDGNSRSQSSVPLFADCDQYDNNSMLGMPPTDSSGTLPPQRQETMTFPLQSLSQSTLPHADDDPLADTCCYLPQDDSDPANTICTPRPTVVHSSIASHSQATPSNKLSGGYYSSASLCEDDAPFECTLRPSQNTITPHITHHHFANVMCTPQTSRVETEMRCALTAELETTNTLFYRVAPPLVTSLTDRVFLGGYPGEETLEELRGHGITHIINCCPTYKPPTDDMRREFQCHVIDAQDDPTFYILSEHMNDFRAMMDAAVGANASGNNSKVFVHCAGGVNRSVALVVAYLCEHLNLSPVCVVRMFRQSGRPYILSNTGFRIQLVEHYLHNVRTDLLRQ